MLRSPGGGAITAIGARRLGLTTALVAPLGDDLAGRFVRLALEEEGVEVGEPRGTRTPTTVVMPVGGERSMVTVDPGVRARASDLEPLSPRAVAATLEQIDVVPAGVCAYLTCGDDDARAFAGRLPRSANRPRALIVNRREAGILTGESSPEEAARAARHASPTRPSSRSGRRARSPSSTARPVTVAGVDTSPVLDTTGAGDLFAAAFLWGDLLGVDAEVALGWAEPVRRAVRLRPHRHGRGGHARAARRGGRAARDAAAPGGEG